MFCLDNGSSRNISTAALLGLLQVVCARHANDFLRDYVDS